MVRAWALLALLVLAPVSAAPTPDQALGSAQGVLEHPEGLVEDPVGTTQTIIDPEPDPASGNGPGAGAPPESPGFVERIREGFNSFFSQPMAALGIGALAAALAGVGGLAFVSRHISPKEALRNPQRSMLYGYVRGNPGVHLKKLSEEFRMKTSSILWHIRKLEAAELVRSDRANGFRVFYPVEGGAEARTVSRAVTALQNGNARRIFESLDERSGQSLASIATRLSIQSGTTRWHLRKLREYGLVQELLGADGSTYFATPMGRKALAALIGQPTTPRPLAAPPVALGPQPVATE